MPKRLANNANQGTRLEEGEGQVDEMLADLIRQLGIDSSVVKKLNTPGRLSLIPPPLLSPLFLSLSLSAVVVPKFFAVQACTLSARSELT